MNRKVLMIGLVLAAFSVTGNVSAQSFLKKVMKAVDETTKAVDKVSDMLSGTEQQPGTSTNNASSSSTNQLYRGNYGTEHAKPIVPHRTANTKLIAVAETIYNLSDFSDGVAYVNASKGFYIDTLGNRLFYYNKGYDDVPRFSQGVAVECDRGEARFFDKTGKKIKTVPNIIAITPFVDGIAAAQLRVPEKKADGTSNNLYIYLNTKGEHVFKELSYNYTAVPLQEPRRLSEGLCAFFDYKNNRWGFRDTIGNVVIAPQFERVHDFSDGLATVKVADKSAEKWGYIDKTGKMVIEPVNYINEPGSFGDGLAPICSNDVRYFYIDKSGKVASKNYYGASEFHNGQAFIKNAEGIFIVDKNLNYISAMCCFNVPTASRKNDCEVFFDGEEVMIKNALVSPKGDVLISYVDGFFKNGLAVCQLSGHDSSDGKDHIGYINRNGEYVFEFVKSEL